MKIKPIKHKTTNTFKFITFAERINSIDIRHAALYHIEHAYTEQPEENETHFHIALRKWHGLNLTENFKKFRKDVGGIITVPQLLHRKEHVLETLEHYLLLEDQLCLQPLLEILVSLAKDLRDDFYPHFPKFLDILIKLLDTKDGDRLEWTLICLAFLFKILKPYLKKDINVVLKRIIPLLSENKPQFINNFAAESFAFVARDIRDKKKFILLILNYLETHDDAILGCGHLIFEILRGVSGKFHSCVETYLPLLLQYLKENTKHQNLLFQVLTQTFSDSLQCIEPKEYALFWNCVLKCITELLPDSDDISEIDDNKGLEYILRLAGQVVEHHNGKYMANPPQFVLLLIKIICNQSKEEVLSVCAQIGALLLLSTNISLSQESASVLVKVLLTLPYPNILISFVQNVIKYSQFDVQVLPPFLNFVIQSGFESEAVNTLMKICIAKSPLSKNGIKFFEWVKYPLDFGVELQKFMDHATQSIMDENIDAILNEPVRCIQTLICLPHVEKLDVDYCIQLFSKLIFKLTSKLMTYNVESQKGYNNLHAANMPVSSLIRRTLFLLGLALESAVHITNCKRLQDICDVEYLLPILLPCAVDANYISALQTIDLYLTAFEIENKLTYGLLLLVDSYLKDNIRSPFHSVRLLTTHIYKLFESVPEMQKTLEVGGKTETFAVFSLCYSVESIKPSIQEYRTQLNLLQKLSFNTSQYNLLKTTEFHFYALNYMLGILYSNFKLLWEPVIEYIYGYGNALAAEEFWPTFHKALETSFTNAKIGLKQYSFDDEIGINYDLLNHIYGDYNNIKERPDLSNYRILMLKIMTHCISVCEAKNRDVVNIFLNFIENEYRRNDNANALKTDVEIYNKMEIDDEINEEIAETDLNDFQEVETVNGKVTFKTLINVMQVLAQFKNPRALHKEPIFWELYMEFLKHKNPGLQKYALDCILNYKNKHIIPYKNNLYNIVDENKLKDELTAFKITEDSESLRVEDREDVVPIILRILYGKMTSKLGADKKGGGQTRRAMVMRYLAGCTEKELKIFIEMAFSHFKQYMPMNPKLIYNETVASLNLKSIISPGKLHSVLNLFEVVREYFGGYIKGELLTQYCNIFYAVITIIGAVLAQSEKVHIGYIKVMKNLRTLAMSTLRKVLEQFNKHWTKDELYVIFETLIWPMLPKLYIEGIHSPTVLLKLFNTWCQNPRFYILLITCTEDGLLSPISEIFKLLQCGRAHFGVVNMILDMIEKLLTLTEEDEEDFPAIESFKTLPLKDNDNITNINFGSKILIPFIPDILDVMKRRLANSAKNPSVNARDLFILSRVTELVANPELCDELLHLLLPILVKKVCMNMAEENMEYAINTIINLLNHSINPQKYIKNFAVLFNKVTLVDVRKLLCKLISSIAENSSNKENLLRLSNVVNEMNAFNKRWLEQPDFDRRLDAYKNIYNLSEQNGIDVDLAILIVNNCFYFIRTEKDIGLRDSAGLCLRRILPKLMLKYKATNEGQFLIRDTILSLISSGIRDTKNELLRNECIGLMGVLVRECPESDEVFSDLAPLINKEDVEVDFFENMCHLQIHRRVRALLKFTKTFKKVVKSPAPRTLTNFILPMASMYLLDDNYSDKNTLIDAAIDVISMCCRLLPWYHYEVLLKFYLNKMRHNTDHQKQLTRILISILDSFHYDFSKVKNIELPKSLIGSVNKFNKKENKNKNDPKIAKLKNNENKEINDENEDDQKNNDDDPDMDNTEKNVQNKDDNTENDEENKPENENDDNNGEIKDNPDLELELKAADDEAEEEEVMHEVDTRPAFERISNVSPSVAKRIIKSLALGLLPQLNRAIGKMSEHEGSHHVNRRRVSLERQEEDMLRVPLALALVKLLQRLPGEILNHHLPGVIIKLCSFLKSPLKRVRITARDIVKKVMVTVGTTHLGLLLEHLKLLLTRGFQVHVLVATIHTVLDALKTDFKKGELDDSLKYILEVCSNDLFGALSEEKEVDKLHYKTPEAKPGKKSNVTLMIAAQNVSEKSLIDLILPFKEVLQTHHSKKIVLKVQEALNHISAGLVSNRFLEIEPLFLFLHGIASESIPEFILGAPKREITEKQREIMLRARPDCFIIQAAPKRNREVQAKNVKTCSKANSHVLVEFSLNILYILLKREKVPKGDCKAFIDPIVPLLVDSLRSDHVRVTTAALKCITSLWTIKIVTNTLEENIKEIVQAIFLILHKYATFEITKQNDNYFLVRNAFKAVTVLTRSVKYYTMEADQLKTLLLYAEEDCQNDERQSNSFALLKAILEAKLLSAELHEVMEKIAKMSILSESPKSREEARGIFMKYLSNYSLGKRLERQIHFFVSQLNYELQHGRESSLKFLEMIINKLTASQLSRHSTFLFVALGTAMVNDSAPECRQLAAQCIEALLRKFPGNDRNNLFQIVLTFFNDKKAAHVELAAQLCTRFVIVEEQDFKSRLNVILPIINDQLYSHTSDGTVGQFVRLQEEKEEENPEEKDHSLIQLLNLTEKITIHCSLSLKSKKFVNAFDEIGQQCKTLLAYPHAWVRLKCCKILNQLFLVVDCSELDSVMKNQVESERGFLYYDTENTLRSLVLDLCAQYTPGVEKDVADEVTAVLYQIIKLVHTLRSFKAKVKDIEIENYEQMENSKLNIRWIIFRLRKAISAEVAKAPSTNNIRSAIFTMWMHLINLFEEEDLMKVVDIILAPVVRELSTGDPLAPASAVKQLAGRIGKKLRRKLGDIEYSKLAAVSQTRLNIRRAERKKEIRQEKLKDPIKAAKRKDHLKEKKKLSKKIKLDTYKGKRPKKRKAEDIDLEDALLE